MISDKYISSNTIKVDGYENGALAVFSLDGVYRYLLSRQLGSDMFNTGLRTLCFVMLNPSTADAFKLDPTGTRCMNYMKRFNCNRLYVVNIFALRSTDPKRLYKSDDPCGELNDYFIKEACNESDMVIFAWGNHGKHLGRGQKVVDLLSDNNYRRKTFVLKLTGDGQPSHPLYLKNSAEPIPINQVINLVSCINSLTKEMTNG